MTQEKTEIPLIEDFTESSLLDQIQTKDEEDKETDEEKETREAAEATAKLAEDEEEAARLEQEEKDKLAKEQEEGELTEEEKAAKAKAEEGGEEEGSFWGDVESITGNPIEVDFGDTDPDSPEGAAIREDAVSTRAVQDNLAYLEKEFPEGFKALMHVSNGGKLKDLFSPEDTDYLNLTVEEADVDGQKSFMKNYYIEKGFSDAKALRNVEDDEDSDEGLYENFKTALKEKQDGQESHTKTAFENQEKDKAAQNAQDKQFGETLSSVINTGKVGNFNIPKKDSEAFYKHVLSHVERSGNGYALTIPLTNDNFQEQLQQMFFGFKKGDLSKFVAAKAKTESAKKLRRSLSKEKGVGESASEKEKRTYGDKLPTLGAFEAE